ncbi:MAG TPA: hypothetical protein VM925_01915 [Labilithrix sp.]|nr:hypothetical protein [Labilithrix sp.]
MPFSRFAIGMSLLAFSACTDIEAPSAPSHPARYGPPSASPRLSKAQPVSAQVNDALPPTPAYDLTADRERRAKVAKDELGPKAMSTVVSDIFVVIGPPGWQGGRYEQSVALMKSAMAGFMNERFGRKPAVAFSVYLFPNAEPYEAFCLRKYSAPCIAHFGFYQPGDRYMVMNIGLGLGTLTHEIVHPLVEADFPHAPTWLNEGLASVFEQPQIPKAGEIHGGKNWRHPRLVKALKSRERETARLDRLFGMRDETFRGDGEDLHYAMARYVCQWLDEKGKLWPFYRRWRDDVANDPTGEKSFEAVVGMTPAQAHAAWTQWTLSL